MDTDKHGLDLAEGEVTHSIIGCAFEVLNELGHGLDEKPYENALVVEFGLQGLEFEQQHRYSVLYKKVPVGEFIPPTECPVCGDDVPQKAKSCPGCGADERTGWNEDATRYDGLNLPDAAFDEADTPISNPPTHLVRNITIVVMIVALMFLFVF